MAKVDQKLQKWIRWIRVIQEDIQPLVIAKHVFWSMQALIKANPKIQKPTIFYWYMGATYAAYALMGIRRQAKLTRRIPPCSWTDVLMGIRPQAKPRKDSISLAALLSDIAEEPTKLSRKYYQDLYGLEKARFAEKDFDRYCQKPGDPHISGAMVQDDLNKLTSSASKCEDFADMRIAHWDKRGPAIIPTFKEANEAIDTLHELCLKYRLILLADSPNSLLPVYQYDWQEVFDYPWRQQESPP